MAAKMSELNRMDGKRLVNLGWKVLGDERAQTAEFLRIIATIDRRGLYRERGFSSMFALCVDGYHLSKGQAYVRIVSARAGRRFPLVFEMIARGEIHMTGVALLEKHLTPENHEALLGRAVHKTKDQIQEIVAGIAPKPDAPTSIRRIPRRKGAASSPAGGGGGTSPAALGALPAPASPVTSEISAGSVASDGPPAATAPQPAATAPGSAPGSEPRAAAREQITPRSPDRFMVRFTASKRCTELMRQAKDLMSHQAPDIDADELTEAAYELLVQALLKKKHKVTDRPRKTKSNQRAEKGTAEKNKTKYGELQKSSRYIPAEVKRAVWQRDGGCCTYVSEDGRRCGSTRLLEYDHIELKTYGGGETVDNLRLRCRAHNRLTAEHALGEAAMTLFAQGFRPVPKESSVPPPGSAGITGRLSEPEPSTTRAGGPGSLASAEGRPPRSGG